MWWERAKATCHAVAKLVLQSAPPLIQRSKFLAIRGLDRVYTKLMYQDWETYGPINGSWGGHEWWFAHWPLVAAILAPFIILVVLWTLVWKGLALWHAARRGEHWWF